VLVWKPEVELIDITVMHDDGTFPALDSDAIIATMRLPVVV